MKVKRPRGKRRDCDHDLNARGDVRSSGETIVISQGKKNKRFAFKRFYFNNNNNNNEK